MSNTVTIKQGEHVYIVPMHEFSRYWLPNLDRIELPKLPNTIPAVSVQAAKERGGKYGQ